MVKVTIKRNHKKINEVLIKGHAKYAEYGQDIVCAAISTMAITTINIINELDTSIDYEEKNGLLKIKVLKETEINQKILENLILQLEEIKDSYPKNIEIRNEV